MHIHFPAQEINGLSEQGGEGEDEGPRWVAGSAEECAALDGASALAMFGMAQQRRRQSQISHLLQAIRGQP